MPHQEVLIPRTHFLTGLENGLRCSPRQCQLWEDGFCKTTVPASQKCMWGCTEHPHACLTWELNSEDHKAVLKVSEENILSSLPFGSSTGFTLTGSVI